MALIGTFRLWFVFTVGTRFHLGSALGLQGSSLILDPTSPPPLPRPSQLNHSQNVSITLQLLEEPTDVTVVRGQEAIFKCLAKSDQGEVNITWYHEGQAISKSDLRWSTDRNGTILRILEATGGKRGTNGVVGNYNCLITNEAGSLRSRTAKLRVAYMDKDVYVSEDQEIHERQPLALYCYVHSTPPANISWELNQLPLPKDERYIPLPNGTLVVRSTLPSDTGNVRCIATNHLLNKTKQSRLVSVKILPPSTDFKPPIFLQTNSLQNKTVLIGESVEFHCFASGNPLPTIQWYVGDELLPHQNSSILSISKASAKDSNFYTCFGINSVGQISQKFYLNVFEKPTFNTTPLSMNSPAAKTIRLNCSAKGIPQPKILWYKNGEPLVIEGRIKKQGTELVFAHTFTYDSGIYQCFASNWAGQIWTSAQIKINKSQNPDPPVDVKCRPFDDSTICLSWKNPTDEQVQAYSISSFYTGDNSQGPEYVTKFNTYEASDLKKSTNYTFYIRSYTTVASDRSESVICQTGLQGSRNLTITQQSPISVVLRWNNLSTDVFCNGTKEFFRVSWRQIYDIATHVRTKDEKYLINGLIPGADYEFRVSTESNPQEGDWLPFSVPEVQEDSNYTSQDILYAPRHFQGESVSSTSVELQWDAVTDARYYTVCYIPVREQRSCQENEMVKSTSRKTTVDKLKPNTLYSFQVMAHDFDNVPGMISQPIEIQTPDNVPSKVLNLQYQMLNSSAVCIHWQKPKNQYKTIQNYVISYTPDQNWPLEKWIKFNVSMKSKNNGKNLECHLGGAADNGKHDMVSVVLSNLTSGNEYMLVVTAVNEHGAGNNAMLTITPNAASDISRENKSDMIENREGGLRKSKIGIIVGVLLALLAIAGCIVFVLLKRHCLKRHAFGRPRVATSGDYHQPVAHYTTHLGAVQVKIEEPCSTDAHENDQLVPDENALNPSEVPDRLNTMGECGIPNGRINGRSKIIHQNGHLPNGCLRITENPQYMVLEQNGDFPTHCTELEDEEEKEDSNSNVKNSKFFDLQKLFEKSKNTQKIYSERSSVCSDDSLNATQSTNLEESRLSHNCLDGDSSFNHESKLNQTLNYLNQSAHSSSRLSPILVPNG